MAEKRKSILPPFNRNDRGKSLSRAYLFGTLILLAVLFLYMVRMFIIPVVLAASFSGLFYGLYRWMLKRLKGRRNLASLLTVFLLLLGLLLPIYGIANLVAREAVNIYQSSEQTIQGLLNAVQQSPLSRLKGTPLADMLKLSHIDWQKSLSDIAKMSASMMAQVINKTSQSAFQFIANLFIVLFTMFYFFRDGEALIERIKYLSPLQTDYENELIKRFGSVTRATVRGSLLMGLIQGTLGTLTLWGFGVPSPILWGVVMTFLSVLPVVGAWMVLYPAAIYKFIIGDIWQGVAIVLITALIISNVDNLLRPRLVGRDAGMHDLMIFFSTLGGIAVFGIMGFIIGPLIAALLLTFFDIYSKEFRNQLEFYRHRSEPSGEDETDDN